MLGISFVILMVFYVYNSLVKIDCYESPLHRFDIITINILLKVPAENVAIKWHTFWFVIVPRFKFFLCTGVSCFQLRGLRFDQWSVLRKESGIVNGLSLWTMVHMFCFWHWPSYFTNSIFIDLIFYIFNQLSTANWVCHFYFSIKLQANFMIRNSLKFWKSN